MMMMTQMLHLMVHLFLIQVHVSVSCRSHHASELSQQARVTGCICRWGSGLYWDETSCLRNPMKIHQKCAGVVSSEGVLTLVPVVWKSWHHLTLLGDQSLSSVLGSQALWGTNPVCRESSGGGRTSESAGPLCSTTGAQLSSADVLLACDFLV